MDVLVVIYFFIGLFVLPYVLVKAEMKIEDNKLQHKGLGERK